jgi:hypothetical protein
MVCVSLSAIFAVSCDSNRIPTYKKDTKLLKTIHSWWLSYLQGLAGISTFGASVTFAILTTVADPSSSRFDKATIQTFIAVSFLLFLIVIGICNFLYYLIYFGKDDYFNEAKFKESLKWMGINFPFNQWLHCANLLVTSILLFAFLMLALVIIGYAEVVGCVTLGCVGLYYVAYLVFWVHVFNAG